MADIKKLAEELVNLTVKELSPLLLLLLLPLLPLKVALPLLLRRPLSTWFSPTQARLSCR